ncbi:MAG: gamma-glutamyl-gamma-aminobutyrate hydrolase family protein [Buchananella hordeovulneris]|nr:gamma-glutamyl-gamma-aminobutyrate hydrolase family protein [Buchananella hordeovulneris]
MTPFLLLSLRPEESLVQREYELFKTLGGLRDDELELISLEEAPLPELELAAYAGVIIGGSPYRHTTPEGRRTPTQERLDRDLNGVLSQVLEREVPCLATGYGLQALVRLLGGAVSALREQPVGGEEIRLTEEGRRDPLLADLPVQFTTFVAHHDGCTTLPEGATVLATSHRCPVQVMRVRSEVYGVQFNPEVNGEALQARLAAYEEAGFYPDDDSFLYRVAFSQTSDSHPAGRIIRNFVEHNARLTSLEH